MKTLPKERALKDKALRQSAELSREVVSVAGVGLSERPGHRCSGKPSRRREAVSAINIQPDICHRRGTSMRLSGSCSGPRGHRARGALSADRGQRTARSERILLTPVEFGSLTQSRLAHVCERSFGTNELFAGRVSPVCPRLLGRESAQLLPTVPPPYRGLFLSRPNVIEQAPPSIYTQHLHNVFIGRRW